MNSVGFGGGCHWCTEAVFQPLRGVSEVHQGFIRADPPHDAWSEAVRVVFDPRRISLRDLLSVHLLTHASTSDHSMRGKYRSAVYVDDAAQRRVFETLLARISVETGERFVTQVLILRGFRPSDERFWNYYRSDPERPFCQTYIAPKLARLRDRHRELLRAGDS